MPNQASRTAQMPVNVSTLVTAAFKVQEPIIRRQDTVTQSITYADYTTTSVVTLARGDTPTAGPPPPPLTRSPPDPDGLGREQVGIIVGTCLGAFFLVLVVICICCACNRPQEYDSDSEEQTVWVYAQQQRRPAPNPEPSIQAPRRCHYPQFPHSIPPPLEPTYRAVAPETAWCAYDEAHGNDPDACRR
ncbi:hypothetical protein F5B20DRAFT_253334 [Whalleya microplaca]|nr:hypothetical protein F5B20DRAFT_253334 [Whalleya microplaca]